MPDDAGFRLEAARAGAKVPAMTRALGSRGLAMIGAGRVRHCGAGDSAGPAFAMLLLKPRAKPMSSQTQAAAAEAH